MAKYALPSIFTFGNMIFGILSLLMSFEGNYKLGCIFILAAGLLDRYDGRIARLLDASTDLGKELDSLADLVSFGVAPSILMYCMYGFVKMGALGYALALIFPIAGAYRLARYNSVTFDNVFTGIPITVAGMFLALYSLITIDYDKTNLTFTIVLIVLLSYLMVSKFRFKKV